MNEKTITQNQLLFVIIKSQIGIGLLSLPFTTHQYAKSYAWISIIVAGICVQIFILIIWLLMREHKGKTVYEITQTLLGKYLGNVINFSYILYGVLVMSLTVVLYGDLLQRWILEKTPKSMTFLLIISAGIYLGKQNLRVIARFFTLIIVLPFIFFFFLSFFAFTNNLTFTNLLPIGQTDYKQILLGSHAGIISLLGFEILLVIFPFAQGKGFATFRKASWANALVVIFYLYFTILSLLIFSPEEISIIPEPVLYMLKGLSFRLVERIDMLFLSYWIFPMMTSFVVYLYIASMGAAKLFHKGKRKYPVWYLSILAYGISFIPTTETEIKTLGKYVALSSYLFIGIIPLTLLVISWILKKSKNRGLNS